MKTANPLLGLLVLLPACAGAPSPGGAGPSGATPVVEAREPDLEDLPPTAHRVEVTAIDYAFEAPDSIPSGWNTFLLRNEGEEHHFVYLSRLPEGRDVDDYILEIGEPFREILGALQGGELDRSGALERTGRELPRWYGSIQPMGGPGLLLPGGEAQATLNLEPGTYVLECYMKTSEGEIHAIEGMIRELVVTEESTGALPPEPDFHITLSNFDLEMEGRPDSGVQTVAIHFAEHPEVGFGHDVHLVRLDEDDSVQEVVPWLDWFAVGGLRNPAPVTFHGGTHEMPEGYTAYVTVRFEPGRYAWVSESTAPRGVLREFTVFEEQAHGPPARPAPAAQVGQAETIADLSLELLESWDRLEPDPYLSFVPGWATVLPERREEAVTVGRYLDVRVRQPDGT